MFEEHELKKSASVNQGTGGNVTIGNVTLGDVSGQAAFGKDIIQKQSVVKTIGKDDLEELRKNLNDFQKEIARLGLSSDDQNIVSGRVSEAIKEAKKDAPSVSKVRDVFGSAVDIIKEAGKTIKDVSELYEPAKKIVSLIGLGLSILP